MNRRCLPLEPKLNNDSREEELFYCKVWLLFDFWRLLGPQVHLCLKSAEILLGDRALRVL